MEIKPTQNEIDATLDAVTAAEAEGSKFPGMSFEAGVRYTIDWLVNGEVNPMED